MSLYTKICVALFGICGGIVVLFALDMTLNSGRFIAHAVHQKSPGCSGTCHGSLEQDAQGAAAVLVLPTVQAADRPAAVEGGPWCHPLLGMPMAADGGH